MPSATLEDGAPLDNTMGALLLGLVGSAVLYGISLVQTLLYFTKYRRDPRYIKLLVIATLFFDTVHMGLIIHVVYHYLITNFYKSAALQHIIWSIVVEALPTGLTAVIVQGFYAWRVYKLSDKNILLTGIILVLALATTGCGIAWIIFALSAPRTYERLLQITPLTIAINALSTAADIIIAATLCYMLHRARTQSMEDETFVNRMILFTISTGLLTSVFALSALISIVCSSNSLIYAAFYFCIGRLYSNALLASLNARSIIRGHIRDVDSNFHHNRSGSRSRGGVSNSHSQTVLTAPADIVAATELAAHLEREAARGMYGFGGGEDGDAYSVKAGRFSMSANHSSEGGL
ncbi:hypothetical protein R3P38DRAFT_3078368 [Favolaschia claudopus]|uniref:DUF6534 domain-containing protein n=1 Tax=Favolaschia claudopus TaxID=2862362 RepID=A0AAV9ZVU7_9AGAR